MYPTYDQADQIQIILDAGKRIVIVQADNPDADSLGSALALEQILGDLGYSPYLYCGIETPSYLRYMDGWDRVNRDLPSNFDSSIIVDASTMTLLEKVQQSQQISWLASKPCIVIDHHEMVENKIPFSSLTICDPTRSSAGELIYMIAKQLGWTINPKAQSFIMSSILGDTQGLTNQLASAYTYKVMAEMIESGISRTELEDKRREYGKMDPMIFKYKAVLIERTELLLGNKLALVSIPQSEINTYSPLYNPGPLVQPDMLQTEGVQIAIVLKQYDDGKVTGAIRANSKAPIAGKLAEHMGGGGHKFAAGFKVDKCSDFTKLKQDCVSYTEELLNELTEDMS
jgi:phosphoesterase RecJ-like protein